MVEKYTIVANNTIINTSNINMRVIIRKDDVKNNEDCYSVLASFDNLMQVTDENMANKAALSLSIFTLANDLKDKIDVGSVDGNVLQKVFCLMYKKRNHGNVIYFEFVSRSSDDDAKTELLKRMGKIDNIENESIVEAGKIIMSEQNKSIVESIRRIVKIQKQPRPDFIIEKGINHFVEFDSLVYECTLETEDI